jgi:RNA polymerase sigma-70 factor, ECF subfamily
MVSQVQRDSKSEYLADTSLRSLESSGFDTSAKNKINYVLRANLNPYQMRMTVTQYISDSNLEFAIDPYFNSALSPPVSLDLFIGKEKDWIMPTAWRVTGNYHDAQDVSQEVFLGLINGGIQKYDATKDPKIWIATLARHQAIDFVRTRDSTRNKYRHSITSYDTPIDPLDSGNSSDKQYRMMMQDGGLSPEAEAIQNEAIDAVMRMFKSLRTDKRRVLEMFYFDNLTISQIAVALNIPEGTARSRLYNGLEYIRQSVGALFGDLFEFKELNKNL